jgi:hypothetical protein
MSAEPTAFLHPDVPMSRYVKDDFTLPPTLNSGLAHVLLTKSPAHVRYLHPKLNPAWVQDDDRDFDLGTCVHAVLLEGKSLNVLSFPDYRTNAAKQARQDAKDGGMIPVLVHQASDVAAMVAQARALLASSPDLKGYDFADGETERTLIWQQSETWLRARPDWISRDRKLVISVKTTRQTAEPDGVMRGPLLSHAWDLQAAFELAGIKAATGIQPTHYVWCVIECEPPFACSLAGLAPMTRDLGEQKLRRAVHLWAACLASDHWPAYGEHVFYPDPPEWAMVRFAERHMFNDPADEGVEAL